jgi:hypothetical protein
MVSLADVVRKKVETLPFVKHGLAIGIVNYSAFAKKIKPEIVSKLGREVSEDAIIAAARRYAEKLRTDKKNAEEAIAKVLGEGKVRLLSGRADLTLKADWRTFDKLKEVSEQISDFHIIQGAQAVTLICNNTQLEKVRAILKDQITHVRQNLVELSVTTPELIETTPGIVSYLTTLLAENNINLIEVVSCYTDTILILEEKEAMRAFEIVQSKIREFGAR